MKKKILLLIVVIIISLILLTGCMPGDGKSTPSNPAGFFWGIWHGWIAPFSLVMGLFYKNIRMHEVVNTGWWYDLGFYMAILGGFGSFSIFRKSSLKNSKVTRRKNEKKR